MPKRPKRLRKVCVVEHFQPRGRPGRSLFGVHLPAQQNQFSRNLPLFRLCRHGRCDVQRARNDDDILHILEAGHGIYARADCQKIENAVILNHRHRKVSNALLRLGLLLHLLRQRSVLLQILVEHCAAVRLDDSLVPLERPNIPANGFTRNAELACECVNVNPALAQDLLHDPHLAFLRQHTIHRLSKCAPRIS